MLINLPPNFLHTCYAQATKYNFVPDSESSGLSTQQVQLVHQYSSNHWYSPESSGPFLTKCTTGSPGTIVQLVQHLLQLHICFVMIYFHLLLNPLQRALTCKFSRNCIYLPNINLSLYVPMLPCYHVPCTMLSCNYVPQCT